MMRPETRLSIGSGYIDTIEGLNSYGGLLHFRSTSKAVAIFGLGVQTATMIRFDPEIARPFFSTPNYKNYIGGHVDRKGTFGKETVVTMQNLLTKSVGLIPGKDTAYYDEKLSAFIILSPVYPVKISDIYQNVDMTIDLHQWSKDTGRLVERRPQYGFSLASKRNDAGLSFGSSPSYTSLFEGIDLLNSWIENPVDPTTLESEDDSVFTGNAKQNMTNRHPAKFFVALSANNRLLSNKIPIDVQGNWKYSSVQTFKAGTVIKAWVIATEERIHENGTLDVNLSSAVYYTVGKDGTSWEDWKVKVPSISMAYNEETMVTGFTPDQNRQNGRTYDLFILLNGVTMYSKEDVGSGVYEAPVFGGNLATGDRIEAYIIGKEPGKQSKMSGRVSTIVLGYQDGQDDWNKWAVIAPVLDDIEHGDDEISGVVPPQNKFNNREYDVIVSVNGIQVGTQKFTFNGGEFKLYLNQPLVDQDVVTAKVVGHEIGKPDKISQTVTKIVSDSSNWEMWVVNKPTIDEAQVGDTSIHGSISQQNTEFGRQYQIEVSVNGKIIGKQPEVANSTYTLLLPSALEGGDVVTAKVIGSQASRPDKESEVTESSLIIKKQNVIVAFVDKLGSKLHVPVVLSRDIGAKINLKDEVAVQNAIKEVKNQSYDLVVLPIDETDITVGTEEKTVVYQFEKSKRKLKVTFVDEEGVSIHNALVFTDEIGAKVNLKTNLTIQNAMNEVKEKHYKLDKAPDNEEAQVIGTEDRTVAYTFTGSLFLESVPSMLDFGNKYLTRPMIKAGQPKYDAPLIVRDNRKDKTSWKLSVTLEEALTSEKSPSEVLHSALSYRKNDSSLVNLQKGEIQLIEVGTASASGGYNISDNWMVNKTGLQLNVFSNKIILKGKYKATILWQVEETY